MPVTRWSLARRVPSPALVLTCAKWWEAEQQQQQQTKWKGICHRGHWCHMFLPLIWFETRDQILYGQFWKSSCDPRPKEIHLGSRPTLRITGGMNSCFMLFTEWIQIQVVKALSRISIHNSIILRLQLGCGHDGGRGNRTVSRSKHPWHDTRFSLQIQWVNIWLWLWVVWACGHQGVKLERQRGDCRVCDFGLAVQFLCCFALGAKVTFYTHYLSLWFGFECREAERRVETFSES